MALESFLVSHRGDGHSQGQDAAVCGLKGGRHFISPAEYPRFLDHLHDHIFVKKQRPLNLVEQPRPGQPKPLLIDLDLKYPLSSTLAHRFESEHVRTFIDSMCEGLNVFFNIERYETLRFFVSLRPQAYQDKGKAVVKDGIHIQCPDIALSNDKQRVLRAWMLENKAVEKAFGSTSYINEPADIYDESMTRKQGWFFYGESKPDIPAYGLDTVLAYSPETGAMVEEATTEYSSRELIELLSVRYGVSEDDNEVRDEARERFSGYLRPRFDPPPPPPPPPAIPGAEPEAQTTTMYIPDEHDPEEIALAQKLAIQCLSAARAENYSTWMEVGWCLYNVDPSEAMFDTWREFSAKSGKATGTDWGKLRRDWMRGFSRNTPGAKFTLKSLHFWARADSPAEYKGLIEEDHVRFVQTRVDDTHYHVALLLRRMYKGKFCASIEMRKSEWYVYDDTINSWRHTNQGMELREKLSIEVASLVVQARDRLKKKAWEDHCAHKAAAGTGGTAAPLPDDDFFKMWALTPDGNRFTTLMKVEKHLYTTEFKNCVMKEAQEIFSEQDFQNRLNMSTTLFGCRNGVLDLRAEVKDPVTGRVGLKVVFRPGRPDDYISQLAGRMYPELEPFDYIPYDPEAPALKALMAVLRQIFTDPAMLAYVIRLMASCLEGANREQCYYTLIGVGGNGKSKLVDLMRYTFGDYSSSLQATALTRKRPESGAANPDIISIKNKRFIYLAEPDDKEPLNTSRMKQFSGEDVVEARGLFEDQQRFRITGKLFMLCNKLPPVHAMDRGTWRRIRAVMFPSLFVDESAPELHQGKANVFLRNNDLDAELKKTEWRQAWLGLLVHVYETEYLKRGLEPIPASVMQESNKYRETFDQYGKFKAERLVDFRDVRAGLTEFGDETSSLKDICSSYTTWCRQNEGTLPGKRLTKPELQARLEEDFGFAEGGSFRRVVVFYDDDQKETFLGERRPAAAAT